jgi:hypothetical protein
MPVTDWKLLPRAIKLALRRAPQLPGSLLQDLLRGLAASVVQVLAAEEPLRRFPAGLEQVLELLHTLQMLGLLADSDRKCSNSNKSSTTEQLRQHEACAVVASQLWCRGFKERCPLLDDLLGGFVARFVSEQCRSSSVSEDRPPVPPHAAASLQRLQQLPEENHVSAAASQPAQVERHVLQCMEPMRLPCGLHCLLVMSLHDHPRLDFE